VLFRSPQGAQLSASVPPSSSLASSTGAPTRLSSQDAPQEGVTSGSLQATPLDTVVPHRTEAVSAIPSAEAVRATEGIATPELSAALPVNAQPLADVQRVRTEKTPAETPAAVSLHASDQPAARLDATLIPAPDLEALAQSGQSIATLPASEVASSRPAAQANSEKITAALAFVGTSSGDVDPQSLAAFRAFQAPGPADQVVRDGLAAQLAALPCARVQLAFDPKTTTLNATGHIPDGALRPKILNALQAQMGSDIAVSDSLRILPPPQCGALSAISDLGLPQSTDQTTDPRLIGQDTYARALTFSGGQQLYFNLTAPDYPAYVYVDYFDATGNVIHLRPNAYAPLTLIPPAEQLHVGARAAADTGLQITVGPPYGQEIVVAFASSHPLYPSTALRPLSEPASPYLSDLKSAIAAARAQHADFKGEWVYFLVVTQAP